jgi:homoserine O-acetyltransferase
MATALAADPKFLDGHYDPEDPPEAGLAAARAVAMVTYRSPASLAVRFGRASGQEIFAERAEAPDDLAVRGWLRHHGRALAARFDANSYLALLDAMDSHDLGRGRGVYESAVKQIRQPVLVGAVITDALYVPAEQHSLAFLLPRGELFEIDSEHGHDGFLIDSAGFEARLRRFVDRLPGQGEAAGGGEGTVSAAGLKFAW